MIDNFFLTEIWNASREECDQIRDDPSLSEDDKMRQASEAIASRIVSHGKYFRMSDLKEITLLPEGDGPWHFAMGLAIGNIAAWRGLRFFDPPTPQ